MPSFEKYLTEVAVNKHLAIPSEFLQHLPDSEGGRTITFPVHDVSDMSKINVSSLVIKSSFELNEMKIMVHQYIQLQLKRRLNFLAPPFGPQSFSHFIFKLISIKFLLLL
ncbi:hypothetical protein E1A91_A01G057500v1 [Gossypium mustelinum]|uniref:Uncharacterized protein n=1 Tax=Gossypium mustelinum TaxID=34275 RepID=A0A5D3ABR5_GOSMU|nr:hypothetical protein E1A91_A01G057500v1 [Gossypium mustelinum]